MKARKTKTATLDNITAKISFGKFGEYTYKSPRWGYKRAYRHHAIAFLYVNGKYIETKGLYWGTKTEIARILEDYKNSSKYRIITKRREACYSEGKYTAP